MEKIPPAEREQFWKFAKENNAGAIKERIAFLMRRHETWEKRYQSGGNYLPLSVWATQGYDTQRIERLSRPEDIMEDHSVGQGVPRASSRRLGEWDQRQVHHR